MNLVKHPSLHSDETAADANSYNAPNLSDVNIEMAGGIAASVLDKIVSKRMKSNAVAEVAKKRLKDGNSV